MKFLTKKVSDRITADQALNHPWIAKNGNYSTFKKNPKILRNIQLLDKNSTLKNSIYYFFATNLIKDDDKVLLIKSFLAFDNEAKGYIDIKDLNDSQVKIKSQKKQFFNFSEFLVASIGYDVRLTTNRIENCFRWFDKVRIILLTFQNKDGEISISEFKTQIGGSYIKNEDWELALRELDRNRNGKIDFYEFLSFFRHMAEESTHLSEDEGSKDSIIETNNLKKL